MQCPLTPIDLLRRAFRVHAQRPALIEGEQVLNYRELADLTCRLGNALLEHGLRPGDHVALVSPNTADAILAFHAVPWTGAVLAPFNPRLSTDEYAFLLRHSDAKLALVDAELLPVVRGAAQQAGVPVWTLGPAGNLRERLRDAAPRPLSFPADLDEHATITLNYTSGTTSDPKGVMLTHRGTYLAVLNLLYHLDLRASSRYLHSLPLAHVNGWGAVWAVTAAGAVHLALRTFEARELPELLDRHHVTHLSANPTVMSEFDDPVTARALTRPVTLTLAGSAPQARFMTNLQGVGFRLVHTYGLTETSPLVTIAEETPDTQRLPPDERGQLLARQGYEMLTAGEVSVVDDQLRPVPHDAHTLGEIVVRGNLVMKGYYKNDPATRQALAGGWFHTGDLACVHPDGRIEIRDRSKDVIISGGEHLSSLEVEAALLRHPSVREAVVVAAPHDKLGEVPFAFAVLHEGARIKPRDILSFAGGLLARFKVPVELRIVPALPKTANGKVMKYALRDEARRASQGGQPDRPSVGP